MRFKVIYQNNDKIKTVILNAKTPEDLKNNSNYPDNIIAIEQIKDMKNIISLKKSNSKKNIYELFKQLSIMLNSNLTISDSISLLINSEKNKETLVFLQTLDNAIKTSKDIEIALKPYSSTIGKTTIMFIKMGLENSNTKEAVNSIVTLYEQDISTKDKLKDALRYPMILFISLIISVSMIFLYVIPNFEYIFKMLGDNLPLSTKMLLWIQSAFEDYFIILILLFLSLFYGIYFFYKKYKLLFDTFIISNIPLLSELIKNYYYYRLFLSISIIVNSKYNFQLAIKHSKNVINNDYITNTIDEIINKIKNGNSIAQAFEEVKIFDELTIKLLYTAQYTANYEKVLYDISKLYKERFDQSIKNFSLIFEPFMILIIAVMVLWLILAIMVPMWSMSSVL
ncbi:MAG: type II secretion system F family protein [Campylobacterota bacterium]|nr:type II secretion system F family protein [Campylobacterota bacterium]